MNILATVLGFCAVALFVLSYQLKHRRAIILTNAASRVLYVSQYLLLGALDGAVLDVAAILVSLLCNSRERGFVKKHFLPVFLLSNAALVGLGALTYQNPFSLFAIGGVLFETLALWAKKEKHIRLASLVGAPLWLVFNLHAAAYGSAVGNVIALSSIALAILRYDVLKKEKKDGES